MGHIQPSDEMNAELEAAGIGLVGNSDVLRGVLAGCGDCIKILDLDGRLQFMSEGGKRVMEVEDFSALKGCPWPDFWAGDGNAQAREAVSSAKAGKTANFKNAANTAKGNPRFWDVTVSPVLGPDGAPIYILSISRDITDEWTAAEAQREALERNSFLTQELTHRVKNTLATVSAMAGQSFRGDQYKEGRDVFNRRLQALSAAYNVLTDASWDNGEISAIVDGALAPYRAGVDRISVVGPSITIPPGSALTLALALNELATNSVKYGALSVPEGLVDVRWQFIEPTLQSFSFEWRETNGPEVIPPTRVGFGTRLIKNMLAKDFDGAVTLTYEPGGVVCILQAPVSA